MAFLIIIICCYVVVALIRKTSLPNECLPLLSGGLGAILSLGCFLLLPTALPVATLHESIFHGFFYGLAATGSNQVIKQTVKYLANKYKIEPPQLGLNDEQKED